MSAVWLICAVVIVILAYYTIHMLRYMDDYYRQKFIDYLQAEREKNPHLSG